MDSMDKLEQQLDELGSYLLALQIQQLGELEEQYVSSGGSHPEGVGDYQSLPVASIRWLSVQLQEDLTDCLAVLRGSTQLQLRVVPRD